jgi:sensor domain CHASE-containing protein
MTLRRRTALAVLAACIAAAVVLYFTIGSTLAGDAASLETQRANEDLDRASNALLQDVASINAAVGVWAPWDDTYQFMQDGNQEYIASNLNTVTLLNLDLDFIVYVDTDGQMFYSKAIDAASREETPLPSGLEQFVTGEGLLARHRSESGSVAGLLFLPNQLAIVASQPIVTSQHQGPMAGSLIMGRYLDENEVQRLSEITGLSLELHRVDDPDIPDDFQVARSSLTQDEDTLVRIMDGQTIASYMLVSEINGSPAFVLGVDAPRDIYAQGQRTARSILYLLLGISALLTLALVLGIDVVVVSRLRRFRKGVEAVFQSHSFSERVAVGGRDEVAAAAEVVNQTLDSLERSHRDLVASEARNRALVEAIPDLDFRISREGSILEIRKPQKSASLKDNHDGAEVQSPRDEIFDMIPTEIQHIVMPHVVKALESGQTQIFEFQMSVDGSVSYHEGRVLGNGDGEALVIVRDISEQKRGEESRQNTVLLREIHNRVKSHLRLIRSFPEALQRRIGDPTPGPEEQTESGPQNTEVQADNRPQDPVVAADNRPQDPVVQADNRPQDPVVPAESQPQNAGFVDAVRSSKGI